MIYDVAWFLVLMPQFTNGAPPSVIEAWLDIASKEVCWAKACGSFDRALAWQTALYLQELGYPVVLNADGSYPAPVPATQLYDQVIKKHQVGDVSTEFEIVDKSTDPSGNSFGGFAEKLKQLKLRCVGTLTNTHVLGRRGLSKVGGDCGC